MKKFITLIFLTFILFCFTGCSINTSQYIRPKTKPSENYYTNEIQEKINENLDYTIRIFDMDYYKYYEVNKEEHSILPEFIDDLSKENYGAALDEGSIPRYKFIIEFTDSKYLINIYENNIISVYPWDGVYKEDILTMDGIPDYYNLYKFCEYVKKVSNGFEG